LQKRLQKKVHLDLEPFSPLVDSPGLRIYFIGDRDEKVNRKVEEVLLKKRSKSSSLLSFFENQENIIYKPEFFPSFVL
jgi:hypothetical protein